MSTRTTTPARNVLVMLAEDVACRLAARLKNELVLDDRVAVPRGKTTKSVPPRRGHVQAADDAAVIAAVKAAVERPDRLCLSALADLDPYPEASSDIRAHAERYHALREEATL
jgi:hypothetical protein